MAKPASICNRPLEMSDFKKYDVVADEKLYHKELSNEQFQCLVRQIAQTHDRDVLSLFIKSMQNDLWVAIRKELIRIIKSRRNSRIAISPAVRSLLKYEFSEKRIQTSAKLMYQFRRQTTKNSVAGSRLKHTQTNHSAIANGVVKINVPTTKFRFRAELDLTGSVNRGLTGFSSSSGGSDTTMESAQTFSNVTALATNSLTTNDSNVSANLKAGLNKFWSPPPDSLLYSVNIGGDLSLRHFLQTNFALKGSFSWQGERFSAPFNSDTNTRSKEEIEAAVEASYIKRGRVGVIGTYDASISDSTQSFYTSKTISHTASALAHIVFYRGYVRIGAGGGYWSSIMKLLSDNNSTVEGGAEVHGKAELRWNVRKWLALDMNAGCYANHSKGDFNGWFPSWGGELSATFMHRKVYAKVTGSYGGFRKNADFFQTRHIGALVALLKYRPTRRWEFYAAAAYGTTRYAGHQQHTEQTWRVLSNISWRVVMKPEVWLTLASDANNYSYDQPDYRRSQLDLSTSFNGTVRF